MFELQKFLSLNYTLWSAALILAIGLGCNLIHCNAFLTKGTRIIFDVHTRKSPKRTPELPGGVNPDPRTNPMREPADKHQPNMGKPFNSLMSFTFLPSLNTSHFANLVQSAKSYHTSSFSVVYFLQSPIGS